MESNESIEGFQKYLLDQTFDNPLFASWSLRIKYRETLIKTIIGWVNIQVEKHENAEVNSRWYDLIVDLASRGSVEQDWCHTVYLLVSSTLSPNERFNKYISG